MNSPSRSNNGSGQQIVDDRSLSIVDLLDNVFYFRWHFIVVFFLITSLSLIYAVVATPIFTADVLIQVEEKKGTSLGALTQVANALGAQQSPVIGEIEIIRSRSIIGRAVSNLKANVEVQVENRLPLIGNFLSRILERDSEGLVKPLWDSTNRAWGGEQLTFEELVVPNYLIGKPLTFKVLKDRDWEVLDKEGKLLASGKNGGLVTSLNGALRLEVSFLKARPGTSFRIVVYSVQSRVNQVLAALTVVETKRQSNILKLTYESAYASYASIVLNEIADVYLQQNIGRRSEEAELSLRFLNDELPKLRVQLDASEKALNDFRSKSKTVDISMEIKELLAKATQIEKTYFELDLKRREFSERYDPSHPLMKALVSQIAGIKAESAALTDQIGRFPAVEQNYIRLARDVQVNNQLYVGLLNNAQQLQIAKAGTVGNVAIVDRAITPEIASRPKKALITAIGALVGILAGFVLCQVLALISKIVRDPRKLEQETGLATLAILPLDDDQFDQSLVTEGKPFLLAKEKPNASSIEALRSLRTAVLFRLSEKPRSKVVLITSAVPSQGKSFISVNLSYLFSVTGKKVLLVEADIRLASSKRYLNYDPARLGLSSVLRKEAAIDAAIIKDVFPNLDFLPSGPTVRNPGDLLAGDVMSKLIEQLASSYDFIIIDSPPLLPVHDARLLGASADITLFVARQNDVSVTEVHDAIDVFYKAGNQFDGIVFNGFIPSRMRYGYGYGYSYSYYGYGRGRRRYGQRSKYGSYGKRYGSYGGNE